MSKMCQENNNAPLAHPYHKMTEPCQEWKDNAGLSKKSNKLEFVDIKIEEAEGKERLEHELYK